MDTRGFWSRSCAPKFTLYTQDAFLTTPLTENPFVYHSNHHTDYLEIQKYMYLYVDIISCTTASIFAKVLLVWSLTASAVSCRTTNICLGI